MTSHTEATKAKMSAAWVNRRAKIASGTLSKPGPQPQQPRDNDRIQARQRINVEVRTGYRPHPNSLCCVDCGHSWQPGERRHEYDHYLGYDVNHHYDVEPVCTICHSRRAFDRGEITPFKLKAGGQARSEKRKTHCDKGHPMERMKDGAWRCYECRKEYWRKRNKERSRAT